MVKEKMIIALGRYGDVLNALPIAKHVADTTQKKPKFLIAEAYKDLLDGVSYVSPVIWPDKFEKLNEAKLKHSASYDVILAQVYGHNFTLPQKVGVSFCEDAYNLAGLLQPMQMGKFDKIEIDNRRVEQEEKKFINSVLGLDREKPIVLINTSGFSSKFPFGDDLVEAVRRRIGSAATLVDLSYLRSKRFTDLLGLYDIAKLLITIDTSTLHLAGASSIPYIAMIADTPSLWHGAHTRGNCIYRCRYGKYQQRKEAILNLVDTVLNPPAKKLRLIHAYHVPPIISPETHRRNLVAFGTWRTARHLGNILPVPLTLEDLPRTFQDGNRQMAFVRDLIDAAYEKCVTENDVIMLCNTDTCLDISFYNQVSALLGQYEGFCGPRRDFQKLEEALTSAEVLAGADYNGTDVFVFKPKWWKQNRDKFPDMVLGGEAWDCVMREMMRKQGMPIVKNLIYHERHVSSWETAANRYTLPMQKHNLSLAKQALTALDIGWVPGKFGVK